MSVKVTQDLPVGHVTSGTFSPTLRKGDRPCADQQPDPAGCRGAVDVRGRAEVFVVTKPPFVETDVRAS